MTKDKIVKHNRIGLKILILVSLVAVIFCSVLVSMNENIVAFNWDAINPKILIEQFNNQKSASKSKTINISELDITQTAEYQGNLLLLTNNDIRLLNSSGEEIWYFTHEVGQPVITVNGQWILVYEKNGKSYMVIRDGKVVFEDMLDQEIAFGEVTEKYILFISVSNNGYKRTISFIAPETGIELGALYIDDYFPYYAKTLNNDNCFLLYGLGMNSTNLSTIIRIYDSNMIAGPVANIEIEGLYPVMYNNNRSYIFVGEDNFFCYDNKLNLLWRSELQGKISAVGLFENNSAIVGLSGEKNLIYFYDPNGEEIKNVTVENEIDNIAVFKDTAAVICGSKVLFFDFSGKLVDNVSLSGISAKVHFIDSGCAFLITEHEAVLYNIAQ